jgi:endonuclease/exonuclease/phosphatase family metal-dependent hydrolase
MRVLTYNIHGWHTADGRPNLDAVAAVISDTQADVVGLNEVHYPRVVEGAAGPALEALATRTGMHFVYGPCLRWPAQDNLPADAYGNALLARWPIIASAAHHLTPIEGKEQRGLLEGRILLPGDRTLTVYVTHLDHTDEETRLVQLRAARTWTVRDRHRSHLVLGDFNAISLWDFAGREEALTRLGQDPKGRNLVNEEKGPQVVAQMEKAGYVDAYRLHGAPGAQSYIPAVDPAIRIDYIFASQPLAAGVTACRIWQEAAGQEASDHRPVLAEVEVEG